MLKKEIYQVTWGKFEACQIKDDTANYVLKLETNLIDWFHCFDKIDHLFLRHKKTKALLQMSWESWDHFLTAIKSG